MDGIFCALAYPTFIVVCSFVWYSLLRWSSTCWCEHMRGTPAGNREVMVLLHSPRGLDFNFLGVFFFRAMAHVLVRPWIYILLLNFLFSFLLGIVVCLGL